MTHRFLKGTLLAALGVSFSWLPAAAQTVPTPRLRERTTSTSSAPRVAPPNGLKREIVIKDALVSSTDPIKLPAREPGSITQIAVKRGEEVQASHIVGQVDDTDAMTKKEIAERERDAAQAKAESPHELRAAQQGREVARENYDANIALNAKGINAVSLFDLRRSKFDFQRSEAQIGVAETEQVVARHTQLAKQAQIVAAENEILRRKLVSPVDGVVVQIYKHVGDWAQPGDAIMEIVRMSRVEIEGWVLADEASPSEVYGKPVTIYVDLPGPSNKDKPFIVKGHITFASQVLEGSGSARSFRVATEVDNTQVNGFWIIQPGTQAKMVIDLAAPAVPRASPPDLRTAPAARIEAEKPDLSDVQIPVEEEVKPDAQLKDAPSADVPAIEAEPVPLPAAKAAAPKVEASKAKATSTGPGVSPTKRAAKSDSGIYSPRAYGSKSSSKTAPKSDR